MIMWLLIQYTNSLSLYQFVRTLKVSILLDWKKWLGIIINPSAQNFGH